MILSHVSVYFNKCYVTCLDCTQSLVVWCSLFFMESMTISYIFQKIKNKKSHAHRLTHMLKLKVIL